MPAGMIVYPLNRNCFALLSIEEIREFSLLRDLLIIFLLRSVLSGFSIISVGPPGVRGGDTGLPNFKIQNTVKDNQSSDNRFSRYERHLQRYVHWDQVAVSVQKDLV
jgi:hypothetical protein